jgi:uncharacterized protein YndB with AHSA1/START domain
MSRPDFVYATYIRTTPEKLWAAITNPEFTRQYWGAENISDWKQGSSWGQIYPNDPARTVVRWGDVVESRPPQLLVLSWIDPKNQGDASRVRFEIDTVGDMTRLTVVHGGFAENSVMAGKVTMGWPRVLSSLKSLLESGKPLDTWAEVDASCASPATAEKAA